MPVGVFSYLGNFQKAQKNFGWPTRWYQILRVEGYVVIKLHLVDWVGAQNLKKISCSWLFSFPWLCWAFNHFWVAFFSKRIWRKKKT